MATQNVQKTIVSTTTFNVRAAMCMCCCSMMMCC